MYAIGRLPQNRGIGTATYEHVWPPLRSSAEYSNRPRQRPRPHEFQCLREPLAHLSCKRLVTAMSLVPDGVLALKAPFGSTSRPSHAGEDGCATALAGGQATHTQRRQDPPPVSEIPGFLPYLRTLG